MSQHAHVTARRRLAPLLLFKKRPELLILGCGKKLARPPPELTKARSLSPAPCCGYHCCAALAACVTRDACFAFHQALSELGIRLDCVDTANAVATFNILSQEGRRVAAALLPAAQDAVVDAPAAAPPRSTTGPFPNWRDRERMA
jgi:uncharacterized protein